MAFAPDLTRLSDGSTHCIRPRYCGNGLAHSTNFQSSDGFSRTPGASNASAHSPSPQGVGRGGAYPHGWRAARVLWQRSAMIDENPSPCPVRLKTAQQYRQIAEWARQTVEGPKGEALDKEGRAKLYRTILLADSLAQKMAEREAQQQQPSEPQPERDKSNDQRRDDA